MLLQILLEQESKNEKNHSTIKINNDLKLDLHTAAIRSGKRRHVVRCSIMASITDNFGFLEF